MSGSTTGHLGPPQTNKSLNSGGTNDVDLISNLPECILTHIFSGLPTKDVVRTCVLSKDWEYKWTSIYKITVDDRLLFTNQRNDNACFMKFMDRLLLYSQNLRIFFLSCYERYDKDRVETWISDVFRHNMASVSLYFKYSFGPGDGVILSHSLLHCTSLRGLELIMYCTWKVPGKCCFPNLMYLYLYQVRIRNDNSSTDTLTFTLPVLVILNLKNCSWLDVRFVEICAPALETFQSYTVNDDQIDDYAIKIFDAGLETFETWDPNVENFLLTGTTVDSAVLYIDESERRFERSGLQIRKLLKELSSVGELELSDYAGQAIALSTSSGNPLPKFDKLEHIVMSLGADALSDDCNTHALIELLNAAPFLKCLSVDMGQTQGEEEFYNYDAVETVPACIISHLETVVLTGFRFWAPLNLPIFLLQHGATLKKVSFPCCYMDNDELLEMISRVPKASACVTIDITPPPPGMEDTGVHIFP